MNRRARALNILIATVTVASVIVLVINTILIFTWRYP